MSLTAPQPTQTFESRPCRQLAFADGNVGVRSRAVLLPHYVGPSRAAGTGRVQSREEQAREALGAVDRQ